jgi:hypothetical protein
MLRDERCKASKVWAAERQAWREAERRVAREDLATVRAGYSAVAEYAPERGIQDSLAGITTIYREIPQEVRESLLEAERRASVASGACESERQARREYHSWLVESTPTGCKGSPRSYLPRMDFGGEHGSIGATVHRDVTPESPERLLAAGHPRVSGGRGVTPRLCGKRSHVRGKRGGAKHKR